MTVDLGKELELVISQLENRKRALEVAERNPRYHPPQRVQMVRGHVRFLEAKRDQINGMIAARDKRD